MLSDQESAEDIIDILANMRGVNVSGLLRYLFESLSDDLQTPFIEYIMDKYELMTFDQAMEAASDAKSI
jgi:hypothetical protein